MSSSAEVIKDMMKVAILRDQGLLEERIAKHLNLSQAKVSRLIARARSTEFSLLKMRIIPGELPPELKQPYEEALLELNPKSEGLESALRTLVPSNSELPQVRIFYSGAEGSDKVTYLERLDKFGLAAASYFADLLPSMGLTATCWGKTLDSLAKGLTEYFKQMPRGQDQFFAKLPHPRPDFIPVCGEPIGRTGLEATASRLAARLRRLMGHPPETDHSLRAVAACVPKCFKKKEAALIRVFFRWERSYHQIFPIRESDQDFLSVKEQRELSPPEPPGEPLITKIDSVLTSVGTAEHFDEWVEETARMAGMDTKELKVLTIGNIGGIFLPQPNLKKSDFNRVEEINGLWTGIQLEHLKECGERAKSSKKAGNIVVAIGKNKVEIVRACVREGLVQHLIIDQELAKELAKPTS